MIVPIVLMTIAVSVILFFGIKMFISTKKTTNKKPQGNGGGSVGGGYGDGINVESDKHLIGYEEHKVFKNDVVEVSEKEIRLIDKVK
jgi:hypothetical protein